MVLIAIVGTNLILKEEYEKIDLNDPFYGFTIEKTAPYSVIGLKGNGYGLVQIQSGDSFQLRVKEDLKSSVSWKLRNDTLELSLLPDGPLHQFDKGDPFIFPAEVYIIVPSLSSVQSQNVKTRLNDLGSDRMHLNLQGPAGWVFLQNNSFDSLSVDIREGSLFKTGTNN